jgi:E3 ubiquitin-protein ligase HUWE1
MLDNDITGIITETFSVDDDVFGVVNTVDLKPGGRDIPVTQENKEEYVRLVVEHKLLSSVKDQMENFLKGTSRKFAIMTQYLTLSQDSMRSYPQS